MGKAVLAVNNSSVSTRANGTFQAPFHSNFGGATDVDTRLKVRTPGTISLVGFKINNVGTSRLLKARKNGADATGVANAGSSTAGIFEDLVNTDHYGSGDTFNLGYTQSGTSSAQYWQRAVFEADSGHACFYCPVLATSGVGPGLLPTFWGIAGGVLNGTTESWLQAKFRTAGTLKNLCITVTNNTFNGDSHVRSRKGTTSYGNLDCKITGGITGLFEDTTNSDTVASGDLWNWTVEKDATTVPTSGSLQITMLASTVEFSSAVNEIMTGASNTRTASATVHFPCAIGSSSLTNTVETDGMFRQGFAATLSNMRWYVSSNTYTADVTAQLRVNQANGNQSIVITHGLSGWYEDATHTDTLAANDDFCYTITGGTSGVLTARTMLLTSTPTSVGSLADSDGGGAALGDITAILSSSVSAGGTSTALASGGQTIAVSASSSGTSTGLAIGTGIVNSVANAPGTSSATAVATGINSRNVSASGTSTAQAIGTSTAASPGNAVGTGIALGVGASTAGSVANAQGTSTAQGLSTAGTANGLAQGTSTAQATSNTFIGVTASSQGISTATAVGQGFGITAGNSSGTSTAIATITALKGTVGQSQGTSTANAVGLFSGSQAVGQGTSTANGVGGAIGIAAGQAQTTGTGSAIGSLAGTVAAAGQAFGQGSADARIITFTLIEPTYDYPIGHGLYSDYAIRAAKARLRLTQGRLVIGRR